MSFPSQPGFVGFRTQAAKGTHADPGAVAPNQGVFVKLTQGAMNTQRSLIIPNAEIGSNRDIPDAQLGPAAYVGAYSFYHRMEQIAFFLKACLGQTVDSGTALTGFTHTITPTDTLPWVSVEEQESTGFTNLRYTDCKVDKFHLDCVADGYAMGSCEVVGITQAVDATITTAANQRYDTSGLLIGPMISVTYNSVAVPAKGLKFDVTNNLETNDFRLGSLVLSDVVEKRRQINTILTIRPQDASYWKQAAWGTAAATGIGGTKTVAPMVITVTGYDDIPGATAGVKYSIVITIPNAVIEPHNVDPSGDNVLQNDMNILALRPATGTQALTVAVKNSFATIP